MPTPIEFRIRQHIAAEPERVFAALTDLKGAAAWMPGFVRIEPLDPEPFQVGSRWRETRRAFGREGTEEFEVTQCDAPAHLGLRVDGAKGSSRRGEYLFRFTLVPDGAGTQVVLDGEIRGLTGVMGVVGKLMVGSYKKACARDLVSLASYLRSQPERPVS